jgi:Tfp pilus assembly protein PilX
MHELTAASASPSARALRARQSGVVLMMALIVLVAMTLAGIALVRSVDTSNIIAGNLAFKQSASNAGDSGSEAAVTWLQNTNAIIGALDGSILAQGYSANCVLDTPGACGPNLALNQTWNDYWNAVIASGAQPVTLATDAAGNSASYFIHRLCRLQGARSVPQTDCAEPPSAGTTAASSKTSDKVALQYTAQVYYRITTRITGPRNTLSFIQTIVAL